MVCRSHSQPGEQVQAMPFKSDAEPAVLSCAVQVTQPAYFESDAEHAVLCCDVQVTQPAW